MSLLTRVKTLLGSKTQDNEGWVRQGKFTPVKNLRDMAADSEGWFQQNKFTPGRQISSQINYQKQVSPINRALYTGLETAGRPVYNSLLNIGALEGNVIGALQSKFGNYQGAQKSFDKANRVRQFTGTQGSFDQGTGWNTIKKGGIDAIQTALTGKGLKYVNPVNLGISGLLSGGASKLSGGDFATGVGQGMGATPSIMGFVGMTNPILSKVLGGKLSPLVAGKVGSRLTPAIANVAQGVGLDLARGTPTTLKSMGLDLATGLAGGKGQFDLGTNFSMPRNTMDEVIKAEDMLLNPQKYLEKTISVTKKNANSIRNVQIKKIQEEAARVIDQISAKYLPNEVLKTTSGNVKAQIKALVDLSGQNKLANVNYLTDKSQPIKTEPLELLKQKGRDYGRAEQYIADRVGGKITNPDKFFVNQPGMPDVGIQPDSFKEAIGRGVEITTPNNRIALKITEDSRSIYVPGIATEKTGTGLGTKAMDALKEYADETGKTIEVYKVTNQKYFDKIPWLKRMDDGAYSYNPSTKPISPIKTGGVSTPQNEMVTLYHASPKLPTKGNWKSGTFFAETEQQARYYASSHHNGDINVRKITIPKELVRKEGGGGIYILNNEYPISKPQMGDVITKDEFIKRELSNLSPESKGIKQPSIKIKPSEKIKISALESKPSKPQLSEQSQTLVKQNLDQPRTSLNTQTDQMKNSVPSSVVEGTPSKVSQPIIPQKKYLESVNTTKLKLKPEEKKTLETATELVKDEIQKVKGKTLSNDEVITAAKQSDILQKVITRDQTLEAEAIQLKARQQMVSLDKEVNELSKQGNSPLLQKKIQELLESIKTVNANAADKGRQLQALSIDAGDESVRLSILKDISKIETDTEKIIRESANVDWNNANKVAEFYRKFIKPSTMETLDEYRYNNMLSSPRTHIRNAFSNLVQTFVTRPATLAAQGKFKQTGQYYVGAIKSLPDAVSEFAKAFKGETPIGQQDIKNIPTGKIPKFMTIPSKALEASDRFFTKLISSGEMARGASEKEALDTAAYSLFRQGLNPEGQGKLLNAIDSLTSWTYNAPKAVRWFVPFIRTPMNFAKQWVEYSPSGFLTTIGAKNKGEQIAKAFVGSTIMAVGAKFALDNNTTWSAPTDPKEKEIFYASGRKPFSVKIGDKWVSMMYAGPFALAFAVPAAAKYYQEDNRTALTDTQLEKLGRISMSMAEYLSGQTFLEGMNNFVKFFSGDADYTFAKNMGYTAGQVIPLQGLVRWVSGIIDPVYRKATTFGDQIKSGIPGVSKTLPPYLDPTGEPSTREGYNSFTPYDITPNKSEYNKPLEERQDKLQQNAVINKTVKEMESQLQSGTDPKPVQVGNIFILPEDGEIKKIELKQFSLPKKTGDVEKDKKALSSYKSSITAQIKQVDRLIAAGAMPADQGNELKANLNDLKNQASTVSVSSGGKKSTKSKGGKISLKKSTIKLASLPTFKAPSFGKLGTTSYKTIAKPNIKLSKPKTIVVAPKKKSNTIKIKPMPTMKVAKGGFLG